MTYQALALVRPATLLFCEMSNLQHLMLFSFFFTKFPNKISTVCSFFQRVLLSRKSHGCFVHYQPQPFIWVHKNFQMNLVVISFYVADENADVTIKKGRRNGHHMSNEHIQNLDKKAKKISLNWNQLLRLISAVILIH